jgi:hypothetical protein
LRHPGALVKKEPTMSVSPRVRIARGADTASLGTLSERASTVGANAPTSPLYTGTTKSLIDEFVASGVAAVAAEAKLSQLEQQVVQARNTRDGAVQTCNNAYTAACTQVEKVAVTPADVASCGFVFLDIVKEGLVLPSAILTKVDPKTGDILLHVQWAGKTKRTHMCIVEISPTPVGPSTYVRLEGFGVKRTVPGYAAGTYAVHAATANAQGRSDWFGPVAVIVK